MAKQVQNESEISKSIELKARILMRSFTDEETKKELEYVSIELPDPFGDEDYIDVPITLKWRNDEVMFKFYAKKALRTEPELEFPITLRPLTYKNKDKIFIEYPALLGISPFDGRQYEFRVKGKNDDKNVIIFKNLSRVALGMSLGSSED